MKPLSLRLSEHQSSKLAIAFHLFFKGDFCGILNFWLSLTLVRERKGSWHSGYQKPTHTLKGHNIIRLETKAYVNQTCLYFHASTWHHQYVTVNQTNSFNILRKTRIFLLSESVMHRRMSISCLCVKYRTGIRTWLAGFIKATLALYFLANISLAQWLFPASQSLVVTVRLPCLLPLCLYQHQNLFPDHIWQTKAPFPHA